MDDGGKGTGRAMPASTDLGRMVLIHASIIWFIKHVHVLYLILLIQKPHGRYFYGLHHLNHEENKAE